MSLDLCPICGHPASGFEKIGEFVQGFWRSSDHEELNRDEYCFTLEECGYCSHDVFRGPYTEDMFALLYPEDYESTEIKRRPWIFESICDLVVPLIQSRGLLTLADFGGGGWMPTKRCDSKIGAFGTLGRLLRLQESL